MVDRKIKALWGKEHESFALKNKLCPAAKLLWHWLMMQGELGKESEPDLKEFNNWVKRNRGKGFTRQWLKTAFNQLVECRVVQVVKQYTWHIVKIVTRPIEWMRPPKKVKENLPNQSKNCDLPTSNSLTTENAQDSSSIPSNRRNSSPNKDEVLKVCAEAGIFYDTDKPAEIFNYPIDDVRRGIELFKVRSTSGNPIRNPEGWLIDCLRWRYWERPTFSGLLSALGIAI